MTTWFSPNPSRIATGLTSFSYMIPFIQYRCYTKCYRFLVNKVTLIKQHKTATRNLDAYRCYPALCLAPREMRPALLLEGPDAFQVIGALVDGLAQGFNMLKDSGRNGVGLGQDAQLLFDHGQDKRSPGGYALSEVVSEWL